MNNNYNLYFPDGAENPDATLYLTLPFNADREERQAFFTALTDTISVFTHSRHSFELHIDDDENEIRIKKLD